MATSFSGGRSRSTWKEPPTMGKQLVNFITCGCESSVPLLARFFEEEKVELLSSLQRQRLGRLSFCQSPFLKNYQRYPFETWNTCSLSKEEPITSRQMTL
jgi:hypothetical protein